MVMGTIMLCGVGLVANFALGQTMDDSLTAYLARAGFSISTGSLERFATSDYNFALVAYPAMPTFSTIRWIVLTGSDHLATMDQWIGMVVASTLIYVTARRLRVQRAAAVVVSQLWLAMPVIVLQSQMVLNDMMTLVCVLTAVNYAVDWFEDSEEPTLFVAVVSVLAAVGTKQTTLFMLPSFLLAGGVAALRFGLRRTTAEIRSLSSRSYSWALLACVLFASMPEYLFNLRDFGHPLGPSDSFGYFADQAQGAMDRLRAIGSSAAQVVYASVFSDVPRSWASRLRPVFEHAETVYGNAGYEVDRLFGVGWFGVAPMVLVLVGLVLGGQLMRRRNQLVTYLVTTTATLLYVALFLYVRPNFSVAFSRYMIYPVTLLLVLGGVVFDEALGSTRTLRRVTAQALVAVACVLTLLQGAWSLAGNGTRPLTGPNSAWGKKDSELLLNANGFIDIGASQPIILDMDRCLPPPATVFVALPFKFPLARLFGPNYRRHVRFLPVVSGTLITKEKLRSLGADAVIIDDVYRDQFEIVADGLFSISSGQFTYTRSYSAEADCD